MGIYKKGVPQMIKVLIRRQVSDDHREALISLINQLRSTIVGQPGYLSSETLKRIDAPGEILVISKWQSPFYWKQWYESDDRAKIQHEIDQLPEMQTRYEFFEYE
jgi:heme oxygenase (mycobilin-producing)